MREITLQLLKKASKIKLLEEIAKKYAQKNFAVLKIKLLEKELEKINVLKNKNLKKK